MKKLLSLAILTATSLSAAFIDFRTAPFQVCDGTSGCTVNGITFTPGTSLPLPTVLDASTSDGFGVQTLPISLTGNEVGPLESLTMDFATPQNFFSVILSNFVENDFGPLDERARVRVFSLGNLVGDYSFIANSGGLFTGSLAGVYGDRLVFTVPGTPVGAAAISDYTVQQIDAVPEPSTYALIACGLGALALRRRRANRK
jgi:hypothetical protein